MKKDELSHLRPATRQWVAYTLSEWQLDQHHERLLQLAAEAWLVMKSDGLDELPVVDKDGRYIGLLDVQDLLAAGIAEK